MRIMRQFSAENKRAIKATAASAIIIVLIAAYAFFTTPEKPGEVSITGSIRAPGASLNKITFTNTACGSKHEAVVSSIGVTSGTYAISLVNGYSYNVSITWNDNEGTLREAEVGTLILDTSQLSLTRDWTLQT